MSGGENSSDLDTIPLSSDGEHGENQQNNIHNSVKEENTKNEGLSINTQISSLDPDINQDEWEEKQKLISQVLELQNTLDDLSSRVDCVKEENLKLKSENQVLGQYIENLMAASSVFQSTSPKAKKK
ncbi:short coiled-coil protein B-like [Gigantopelta aegis]|uniref:short coiled-coil protein B-like n=1 Tax=Gigantopelta aegis TaxID=1735272 RepID=UPI001B88BB2B|nr:short coiled-coil protein B-like [Gigantopelta aegis]XP_041358302.1 short coiled-coil protein B-like [Gigantopelta aegis]